VEKVQESGVIGPAVTVTVVWPVSANDADCPAFTGGAPAGELGQFVPRL
jgi:hypothetical protein